MYIKTGIALLFCGFILLAVSQAGQDENKELTMLVELAAKTDSLYYSFDSLALRRHLDNIDNILNNQESHSEELRNYCAVMCLQLGKIYYNPEPSLAFDYFARAVEYLDHPVDSSREAERLALMSSAYGKMSSLSTLSAIYYGIKARDKIYDANKLAYNNPKVNLVAAIHLMHTPASFGGDKPWAGRLLRAALKKTRERKPENAVLNWASEAEIYAYLAQLEILKENKIKAKEYMKKACVLVPYYGFVLIDLQTQLDNL